MRDDWNQGKGSLQAKKDIRIHLAYYGAKEFAFVAVVGIWKNCSRIALLDRPKAALVKAAFWLLSCSNGKVAALKLGRA